MKRLVPEMLERSRLKIKSRAQQITLKPNIMKVKKLLANVSLFTNTTYFIMFCFKVICWALLFIFKLRFPPGAGCSKAG